MTVEPKKPIKAEEPYELMAKALKVKTSKLKGEEAQGSKA